MGGIGYVLLLRKRTSSGVASENPKYFVFLCFLSAPTTSEPTVLILYHPRQKNKKIALPGIFHFSGGRYRIRTYDLFYVKETL